MKPKGKERRRGGAEGSVRERNETIVTTNVAQGEEAIDDVMKERKKEVVWSSGSMEEESITGIRISTMEQ